MNMSERCRPISQPPGFHWFGYYDKHQCDSTDRYVLGMRVNFEHRLPTGDDVVAIGMFDLADGNRWTQLGESRAWSWQQGCMLQWRPGSSDEVIWNDRDGDRFVCRVLNVVTGALRTLPRAIGTISPCGRFALCEDFSRIWSFRPGYAYAGVPDPHVDHPAPAELGVWRLDLNTGEEKQLVSLADLACLPYPGQAPADMHYVNHLSWNPTGERFLFFNRWEGRHQPTRVFTADADGRDLRLLSARGASHWTWRDPEHVLIWALGAYRLYRDDGSGEPARTIWEHPNGHQTYLPDADHDWLLTDTYPDGPDRLQELCLYQISTGRKIDLARLHAPPAYEGEWRCDLHPRLSRCGRRVLIDSAHEGNGRQIHMLDITGLID